jgi:hypothetical protein
VPNKRVAIACQGGGESVRLRRGGPQDPLSTRGPGPIQERRAERNVRRCSHRRAGLDGAAAESPRRSDPHRRPDHRLLEGSLGADAARGPPRRGLHPDGPAGRARHAADVASSPSSLQFQLWSRATSLLVGRQEFTDLRALLIKHIDFKDLPTLVDGADHPLHSHVAGGAGDARLPQQAVAPSGAH